MPVKEIVIIGAGPSGIAAAIQLKRFGLEPVLIEKNSTGGLLVNANLIENYPGFPNGISGKKLVKLFTEHLESAGITPEYERVIDLNYNNKLFQISTNKRLVESRFLIIATGTTPKKLPVCIPDELHSKVFYEISELKKVAKKKIIIIGSGDAAFDYAINLSRKNEVIILNRSQKLKCLPLLWIRSLENVNISYVSDINIEKVENSKQGLVLTCKHFEEIRTIEADYLIGAIGRKPCLDFLSPDLKIDKLIRKNLLYMTGDVKNGICRQSSISTGDGVKAAMKIYKELK